MCDLWVGLGIRRPNHLEGILRIVTSLLSHQTSRVGSHHISNVCPIITVKSLSQTGSSSSLCRCHSLRHLLSHRPILRRQSPSPDLALSPSRPAPDLLPSISPGLRCIAKSVQDPQRPRPRRFGRRRQSPSASTQLAQLARTIGGREAVALLRRQGAL